MTSEEIQAEINEKRQLLSQTDFEVLKAVERFFSSATGASTILSLVKAIKDAVSEFTDLLKSRAEWRERIGELEETTPEDGE